MATAISIECVSG